MMVDARKEILTSKKEFTDTKFGKLKRTFACIKNNSVDSDDNVYLTADFLIEINNIITGSNNITLLLHHLLVSLSYSETVKAVTLAFCSI